MLNLQGIKKLIAMKTKLLLPAVMLCTGLACAQTIDLEVVSDDFDLPIEITHAGDDRLFVVEQGGLIRILNADGEVNETPFLNVSNLVSNVNTKHFGQ